MFGSIVPEKRWDRGTKSWKSEWYKKNCWRNILQLITLTCNRSVTWLDIKKKNKLKNVWERQSFTNPQVTVSVLDGEIFVCEYTSTNAG